jgi:hypothetical protein|tara:strand:+ start:581 stop:763 length:183 start_codon:yes stop_codon:yes gene_type:complete
MKVGDLVKLTRYGCENTVGVVVGLGLEGQHRSAKVRVLWGTTGKSGIYYVEKLEVINASR